MIRKTIGLLVLGTFAAAPALAQTPSPTVPTGETPPASVTATVPVAPPATVVAPVAPNAAVVTQIPGVAAQTTMKIQSFADYDVNNDGAYSPMEFAQAMAFLAAANPAAGSRNLPAKDKFMHKGMIDKMPPSQAVQLLNVTAHEFAKVDMNHDWRITPEELAAAALM